MPLQSVDMGLNAGSLCSTLSRCYHPMREPPEILGPKMDPKIEGLLHSSKLTWKWRGALNEITILYIGPFVSFHVDLREDILRPPIDPKFLETAV